MTSVRIRWIFVMLLGLATMLTGCAAIDRAATADDRNPVSASPATAVDAPPAGLQAP